MNTFFTSLKRGTVLASVVGAALIGFTACSPSLSPQPGTGIKGTLVADGTTITYVALGNSLTGGYQSGAVVANETQYAYPVQIAKQLGLTDFQYPQYPTDGGIGGRLSIKEFSATGAPTLISTSLGSAPSNASLSRPYNNLGIPGALLRDMNPQTTDLTYALYQARWVTTNGLYNPFFSAVLRGNPAQGFPLGRTAVEQAAKLNPNLVSLWIGNNDVLGYASSGGASGTNFEAGYGSVAGVGPAPTEVAVFTRQYNALLDSCVKKMPTAKFIVGNIPDVLAAPYFTTAGPQIRAGLVAILNNSAVVPAALAGIIKQVFPNFPNGLVVASSASPGGFKQITDGDLFVLTAATGVTNYATSLIGLVGANAAAISANPAQAPQLIQQLLIKNPMPNGLVLDEAEQTVVRNAVTAYNTAIGAAIAKYSTNNQAVLFDANKLVGDIQKTGYPVVGSLVLGFSYISGGFFSLDGVHPSSRGYGAVANEMIKVLNSKYTADIPLLEIQQIPALPVGTVQ